MSRTPEPLMMKSGLGGEALLDRAAELVGRFASRTGVHEVEVISEVEVDSFVRFADVGPTQSADRAVGRLALRLRVSGPDGLHEARATSEDLGDEAAERLFARARDLALVSPALVEPVELGGPVELAPGLADEATLHHGAAAKAQLVRAALDAAAAAGALPSGLVQTGGLARALANSRGRAVVDERSRAAFAMTATERRDDGLGGAGFGHAIRASVAELDVAAAIGRAVAKAAPGVERGSVPVGRHTVVLEPDAVSSMLLFASYAGFGAKDVAEEASFLCGRIGEACFSPSVTITDDPAHALYRGLGFDGEGTPKRALDLVAAGVPTGPVTDRSWAVRRGGSPDDSTGHALAQPNLVGPRADSLCIAPGAASTEELVRGVERGLLVTQLHYVNMIDPRDLVLTGMTRNGLFLIEGGVVTRPLKNLRFTESLVEALGRVIGVGSDLDVCGALFDGEVITPALAIEDFRFTSATDF